MRLSSPRVTTMTEGLATGAARERSRHDAASITDREARPELREEQDMADTTTWASGSVTEDESLEIEFLEKWAEDPIDRQRRLGTAPHYTSERERELRANWQMRLQRAKDAVLRSDWDRALGLIERPSRLGLLSEWCSEGCLLDEELRAVLPGTWSDAELDDTEEQWLALWVDAARCGRVETQPRNRCASSSPRPRSGSGRTREPPSFPPPLRQAAADALGRALE